MPVSSPLSSGWRATAWIIEPKMLPMPMPAPSEPRPMPRASAIALPASTLLAASWASRLNNCPPLMLRLDGRADVDGRECGEDKSLDRDDDHDLEEVERSRGGDGHHGDGEVADHEDQPDEGEDQHVAGQHVRVETNGEADQPHELAEDLQWDDQRVEALRHVGDPALEVLDRTVVANPLDVREEKRHQGEC